MEMRKLRKKRRKRKTRRRKKLQRKPQYPQKVKKESTWSNWSWRTYTLQLRPMKYSGAWGAGLSLRNTNSPTTNFRAMVPMKFSSTRSRESKASSSKWNKLLWRKQCKVWGRRQRFKDKSDDSHKASSNLGRDLLTSAKDWKTTTGNLLQKKD